MHNSDERETLPISRKEFERLDIFNNVTFESIAGYLLRCEAIDVEEGVCLIDPEHPQRRLIILLEGLLGVEIQSKGGSFTSKITPGHSAGEMSVFDNIKPSGKVFAKEKSRILVVSPEVAHAMINASHNLCLNFLHILSQRLRDNSNVVCEEEFHIRCIEESSRVDTLTNLHNRRWLQEMYTRELNRSNHGDYQLCAFMLDIDHFKLVNDTYGHLVGDLVLQTVAQSLVNSLRPADMPVRYGGEEFTVFLPGTNLENARIIAERLRKNVEAVNIAIPSGKVIKVTISIGFTSRIAGDTIESIIKRADEGLYAAKENGRNRICQNLEGEKMKIFTPGCGEIQDVSY